MTVDRLWQPIEDYLAGEKVELDDLELAGRTLRVVVDAPDGLDLDHIADLSRGLSRLLDDNDDFMPASYNLEVTSPGLERKLRRPEQYAKSIGREIAVTTSDGQSLKGVLVASDRSGFSLEIGGVPRLIDYKAVKKARTVFTMDRGVKPGKKK